ECQTTEPTEGLDMELLRVRERGQITISKTLREKLGVGENSTLLAYVENGRLILEPVPEPRGDLLSIIGLLPSRGKVERLRQEVCKRSGSDLLVRDLDAVSVAGSRVNLGQQGGGIQPPEPLLGDHEHLPNDRRGPLHLLEPLGRVRTQPQCSEG